MLKRSLSISSSVINTCMSSSIQNMVSNAIGDGARSTKFNVLLNFSDNKLSVDNEVLLAQVKTSSFPSKSVTPIEFKYKGRTIPLRGQVKYNQTWDCEFYLTEDHGLKNAFENWMEALDEFHNYMDTNSIKDLSRLQKQHNTDGYTKDIKIYQRDFNDTADTAEYTLFNAFPTSITPVQTNYSSRGEILAFTVTFSYSYYRLNTITGKDGNFIDEYIAKSEASIQNAITSGISEIGNKINDLISGDIPSFMNANSISSGSKPKGVSSHSTLDAINTFWR